MKIIGPIIPFVIILFLTIYHWPVEVKEIQYTTDPISFRVGYNFHTTIGRYLGLKFKYELKNRKWFDDRYIILVQEPKKQIRIIDVCPDF